MTKKVLLSHPTGNANVRAITMGFSEACMLENFYTTIACFKDSLWLKTGIKDFERRKYSEQLKALTVTMPWHELGRMTAARLGLNFLTGAKSGLFSVDAIYKNLDKSLSKIIASKENNKIIYCYEDGAYYSFQAAKKRGMLCVYDLPIAYWQTARELLMHEAERYPQWKNTLGGGISDSKEKLHKKTTELELADVVVVPSEFVARSLPPWANSKKLIISPFGTPPCIYQSNRTSNLPTRPLRVLFVGSMSQRKGLADLFNAVKLLNTKHIELVTLGSLAEDMAFYRKELPCFQYEPPRPHDEVLNLMQTCDVFCLPSVVEGRALVMQEAMSRGLPVIITKNTGGEDLVKEGETGFLIPVGDPEAIANKLEWFINNRQQVKSMGEAAIQHAKNYTWEKYSHRIIEMLKQTVL